MIRNFIIICLITIFVSASFSQSPNQYKTLATYYNKEQKKYQLLANDEKKEWIRRSQNIVGIEAKYPRPVDSARYLYDYYTYKVAEDKILEVKYNKLANQ